ncbi:MAG: hypothetical protein EOP84_26885 [Verrucomicrobiaceae bacterium]|nr:MAG: hypothetical protein EOP84_26885 [Verrucomicrobiaceae bacterium]
MNDDLMEMVSRQWPEIVAFIPPKRSLVAGRFAGNDYGFCSHPRKVDSWWVHSTGGRHFATGPTPPNFFWLGIKNGGSSEYLFLMWYRGGRKFWFYDQYVVFVAETDASAENTATQLHSALLRWRDTPGHVIYSGPWGWFDVQNNQFV